MKIAIVFCFLYISCLSENILCCACYIIGQLYCKYTASAIETKTLKIARYFRFDKTFTNKENHKIFPKEQKTHRNLIYCLLIISMSINTMFVVYDIIECLTYVVNGTR